MPIPNKARIVSLIKVSASLITGGSGPAPHDYQSLRDAIVRQELTEELAALNRMVSSNGDFVALFKERCRVRASRNAASALSFSAMPSGVVNTLYWDIAMLLDPKPRTMGEVLAILQPEASDLVVHDAEVCKELPSTHAVNLAFHFKKQAITTLTEPPSLERLADFAVSGTTLLDVKTIASWRFSWHRNFHSALLKAYPDLASALYQHNSVLRTLGERLSLLQGKGQAPLQAMTILVRELSLGGSRMTGSGLAARSAQDAFAAFMGYLEALPGDIQSRLLSLSNGARKSLTQVMEHLRQGNCVEIAASDLQHIIDNNKSQRLLTESPALPQSYLVTIAKEYGSKHPLTTKATDGCLRLPETLLEKTISRLEGDSSYTCISLLLSFPPTLYTELLKHGRIPPDTLLDNVVAQRIKEGLLNEEQKTALYKGLFTNYKKFGLARIIYFYLNCGGPGEKLPHFVRECILQVDFADEIKKKDSNGNTPLHCFAQNPKVLQIILGLCPEEERLAAVKERNRAGNTVLHMAALNLESLSIILGLYPAGELLSALNDVNGDKETILHMAAEKPEIFSSILALYEDEEQRRAVLKKRDTSGWSVFMASFSKPEFFLTLLESFPLDQRLAVLHESCKIEYIPGCWVDSDRPKMLTLSDALSSLELWVRFLMLFPENERAAAVAKTLGGVLDKPELLSQILLLIPEADRKGLALTENLFCRAIDYPQSWRIILALYPSNELLAAALKGVLDGRPSLLTYVKYRPAYFAIIQEFLSPMDKIKCMVSVAQLKYQEWYEGRGMHRGDNTFFTRFYHGPNGQRRAVALDRAVSQAESVDSVSALINEFLTEPATHYHTHSFSSFLLDELKGLDGTCWQGLASNPSTQRYDKFAVLDHLMPIYNQPVMGL